MSRQPVVADRFYPGDPVQLEQTLADCIPDGQNKKKALAVVVPHAGYVYSGKVAGETYAGIEVPETVILLGPNHQGAGASLAVGQEDWLMPMGRVPLATALAADLAGDSELFTADNAAHLHEHSLEVQVPFLQYFQKNLQIVPIVVSHITFGQCQRAAREIVQAIQGFVRPVLLVASTDMSHYESRQAASAKDHLALEKIVSLDPEGLYDTVLFNRISMCGFIPTTITLLAALEMGAEQAELVRYSDSGEASGDVSQVVGYAGLVIR